MGPRRTVVSIERAFGPAATIVGVSHPVRTLGVPSHGEGAVASDAGTSERTRDLQPQAPPNGPPPRGRAAGDAAEQISREQTEEPDDGSPRRAGCARTQPA